MKTYPCYQCGYCCTVSPCGFGKWNPVKQKCDLLNDDGTCSIYDHIVALQEARQEKFPMMGCGCSSPLLNEVRAKKMIEKGLDPDEEMAEINSGFSLDFGDGFDKLWEEIEKNQEAS